MRVFRANAPYKRMGIAAFEGPSARAGTGRPDPLGVFNGFENLGASS